MLVHDFSPIAFSLGGFHMRWYGLMYLFGFVFGWFLAHYRAARIVQGWSKDDVGDLLTYSMLSVIIGGRLGYVLFYDPLVYLNDPLEIFRLWNGGMSFHGGLLGVLATFWYFSKTRKKHFLEVSDFLAPLVPQAIFFGRLGNFINGELWGKPSDLPWAMVFPGAGPWPRHPSQLYEAFLEGLVLFVLLWIFSLKKRKLGAVSGLFAVGYACFRFLVEFIRVPDAHLGYIAFGWLTMGQILCIPLLLVGLYLLLRKDSKAQ